MRRILPRRDVKQKRSGKVEIRTWVGLIACNLVWSAHPFMGKLVLESFTPAQGAWFRYTSALLAFWIFVPVLRRFSSKSPIFIFKPKRPGHWLWFSLLGFMTFCFSPLTQLTGLAGARATENSLIIAMEPLLTVFLGWIFLKEKLSRIEIAAFFAAVIGFASLAGGSWDPHFVANLILLISLMGEATYSVLGRKLTSEYPPLAIFGTALVWGVGFLTLANLLGSGFGSLGPIPHFSPRSILGLLWLGPLGTMGAYVYWMFALVRIPVAGVAITLFLQPVIGAALGYGFLGERLSMTQVLGSGVILTAVIVQAWGGLWQTRRGLGGASE